MFRLWMMALLVASVGAAVHAQPAATLSPAGAASEDAIPRAVLDAMDRRELGDLYTPGNEAKLYDLHVLIEKYFAASTAKERQPIVTQIQATGIDPNLVGRLTRIRMYWPKLEAGVYYVNEKVGPHNVIYFVGVPKGYDYAKSWPLVIKLPGAHAFATDPPPNQEQVAKLYGEWIEDDLKKHPDTVVLMPLLNLDELWGPGYKGMNSVIQPLHHVAGRVNIDPARVYMVGHGMSGHAVWNLSLHYPTYFAAINPMSGGASGAWQRLRVPNLKNIWSIAWHDADDPLIPVDASRGMVRALQREKCPVEYEEAKTGSHAPADDVVEKLYTKMRSRVRRLYPKEVSLASNRPDSLFNRNDWVQVYQMLTPGTDKRVGIVHGSGMMTFSRNSYNIAAKIAAANRIEVTCGNVESMRLYFNDQMVDLSKPVTVVVNGKTRFEGLVRPNVDEMLKDQAFLGRGWRYFTAFAEIDFGAPSTQPATRPATMPATRKGTIKYIP